MQHDNLSAKCQFAMKGLMVESKTQLFRTAFCVCIHIGIHFVCVYKLEIALIPSLMQHHEQLPKNFIRDIALQEAEAGKEKIITLPGPQGREEPNCPNHSELYLHRHCSCKAQDDT